MESKATILAVDDSEMNIDILVGILKEYDVIPALTGEDALEILKEEKVDLILLDIIMPEMDGFQVAKQLKADAHTKDIPHIFITVKNSEHDIKQCFEHKCVDYVAKPFNPVELLARVRTHLALQRCKVLSNATGRCQNLQSINTSFIDLQATHGRFCASVSENSDLENENLIEYCREVSELMSNISKQLS